MKTEYRVILTATFDTVEERDKMYGSLKTEMVTVVKDSGIAKRADMTRDEYQVPEVTTVSEQVI